MKYGARNQIIATVADLKEGLGLERGDKVKVIVKAIHVLVVRE